jgi:HlyD family secretion protein
VALWLALRPAPVPVDLGTVERGGLRVTLDEEGETRVHDRFVVSAPLAGRVLRIELEPGDPVTAGESVLATFQPNDPILLDARTRAQAEARVRAAESALGRARADRERAIVEAEFARNEVARAAELADDGIVSEERLDAAEHQARSREQAQRAAEFAFRTAEYQLEVARASLVQVQGGGGDGDGAIVLRSPIDGVVLRRLRESESVVPAGEPILEVADPANLEIVSDMLSVDAVQITAGDDVLIDQWGGGTELRGRVRLVEPSGFMKISALGVEEQRVNVIIDFVDVRDAWQALGDGYRVEVRVIIWEREDVLKVPTSSLFRAGEAWAVYCVAEGRAVRQVIDIGRRNGLEAEVLSGLSAGDRVVVHPSDAVVDGVEVVERTAG